MKHTYNSTPIDPSTFGDLVPFGDPSWYQDFNTLYYNQSHVNLRKEIRTFIDSEIIPNVHDWDEAKNINKNIIKKCAQKGILFLSCGSINKSSKYYKGGYIVGGIQPSEIDIFHEFVCADEFSRCGSGGFCWGILAGISIGLPPILNFGSNYLKDKIVEDVLKGNKVICLCITEPNYGSDVANLECSAVLSNDKKHYIVNGVKKWITNGVFADYFTVAVRTGKKEMGMNGISLLLIERSFGGIKTRQMNCTGVWCSGTSLITFEDVIVPVENLIGKENKGFQYIMNNFNHERLQIVFQVNRFSRLCYEESIKYANKRKTFGKKLIKHDVIRDKLANMARQIEATHNWVENMCYQYKKLDFSKNYSHQRIGGPIALLKAQATKTFEYCARESAQIFGGLSYSRGGQGEIIERLNREVKAYAIPGGSEEIMLDLGMRQSLKIAKIKKAKF